MDSINPNFKSTGNYTLPTAAELWQGLQKGNRASLSRALTLSESKLASHRRLAEELVQLALPHSGQSIRLGITGVPGVGKSTFIENFGEYVISQGKRVAVLAIDPSSSKSKGSILGDKTRMTQLSQNPAAYIRPSPTSGTLGGVTGRTRESILLCEAAGFDLIIVETVGVGQSETAVKSMVDFFILLMLAGAGDELQGIKRGIMEMADLLLINKADGENKAAAQRMVGEYQRALHLFPPNLNQWTPPVTSISSRDQNAMSEVWSIIGKFESHQKARGFFAENRNKQAIDWFRENLNQSLLDQFYSRPAVKQDLQRMEKAIRQKEIHPHLAVNQMLEKHTGTNEVKEL